MKAATIKELKNELGIKSHSELLTLCLRLSNFKKENKELLTYLLFEASDETAFIESVKIDAKQQFELINTSSYYYIKKSVRKILRMIKKFVRYSKKTETEVELLIYFCNELKQMTPRMQGSVALHNIYKRQVDAISKKVSTLHEDLQYDYQLEIEELELD